MPSDNSVQAPAKTDAPANETLHPEQQAFIDKEHKYGAHNYHPLPVVLKEGKGCHMWDTEGRKYLDFLSAYSAVNQGHCHPRIVGKMKEQCEKLTLTSRAFHNNVFGDYAEFITKFFGYEKVLPMNSGVEGTETACKIMRRWGYCSEKKVPENKAIIIFAEGNFWGRSIAALSSSTDPDCYKNFGPYAPGFVLVPYNDAAAIQKQFENPEYGKHIVGVCLEPIQGEAGIIVPSDNYFSEVKKLCEKHNALLCCDEIQTGLCRTGKMLCHDWYNIRADVVVLGKALSGGMYPVSAVLTDEHVMKHITPGCHGSTYGGNPLACVIAKEALSVLKDEKMAENAEKLGEIFRNELKESLMGPGSKVKFVKDVRGKGLLNAVECDTAWSEQVTAWEVCLELGRKGLLAKPTHNNIIRFAPPLCIEEDSLKEALTIIKEVFVYYAEKSANGGDGAVKKTKLCCVTLKS